MFCKSQLKSDSYDTNIFVLDLKADGSRLSLLHGIRKNIIKEKQQKTDILRNNGHPWSQSCGRKGNFGGRIYENGWFIML